MNFFGGGGRKRETSSNEVAPEKTDMMAGDMSAGVPYGDSSSTNFAASDNSTVSSNVTMQQPTKPDGTFYAGQRRDAAADGSPGAVSAIMLQPHDGAFLRQKALVQQVISKLTEVSFDQCIDKPQASLTSHQRACVHTIVGKYLDTSVSSDNILGDGDPLTPTLCRSLCSGAQPKVVSLNNRQDNSSQEHTHQACATKGALYNTTRCSRDEPPVDLGLTRGYCTSSVQRVLLPAILTLQKVLCIKDIVPSKHRSEGNVLSWLWTHAACDRTYMEDVSQAIRIDHRLKLTLFL